MAVVVAKPLRVPLALALVTINSSAAKPKASSSNEMVMVAVSPMASLSSLRVMVAMGGAVSKVMVKSLVPDRFPAKSVWRTLYSISPVVLVVK